MKKMLFAAAMLLCAACAQPKQEAATENEQTAEQTIRINCMVTVSPENRDSVITLANELVEASQKDAGNIDYALYANTADSTQLMIFETWQDQASLDTHSAADHFTRLVPQIQSLAQLEIQKLPNAEAAGTIRINCMIGVTAETHDAMVALAKELVEASQADAGMIDYKLFENVADTNKLMIFETWKDQPSLDAHSAADHFTRLVPQIKEITGMDVFKN